jgi:hypothetical protein
VPIGNPLDVTQLDQYVLIKNADSPDPVPVRNLTTGLDTMVPLAQLAGGPQTVVIAASPDVTTKLNGATAQAPGLLAGIRGYPVAGGATGKQWMISSLVTPEVRAAFDGIVTAEPAGWQDPTARQTFADIGLALIAAPYNASPVTVVDMEKQLFNASYREIRFRVQHGYLVPGITDWTG